MLEQTNEGNGGLVPGVSVGKGSSVQVMKIDVNPKLAKSWFSMNTHNRNFRDWLADRYARAMEKGHWGVDNTAIAFSPDMVVLDGQHRLAAVIRSNTTQTFTVMFNVPEENQQFFDIGAARAPHDRFTLMGDLGKVTTFEVACLRAMIGRNFVKKLTPVEEFDLLKKHYTAIVYSLGNIKTNRRGLRGAWITAPVARAWYSADHEKLDRFCRVISTGQPEGPEDGPIFLLDRFLSQADSSASSFDEKYLKTERALSAFLNGEKLKRLYAASEELFPLPGEAK